MRRSMIFTVTTQASLGSKRATKDTQGSSDTKKGVSALVFRDFRVFRDLRGDLRLFASRLQRERIKRIACADDDVLAAVEQIRLRTIGRVGPEACVPERL